MERLAAIFAGLALAVGAAGCGAGKAATGSGSGTPPRALSAADFTREANAVCVNADMQLLKLAKTTREAAESLTAAISIEGRALADLQQLVPPTERRRAYALLTRTLAGRRAARRALRDEVLARSANLRPTQDRMNALTARAEGLAQRLKLTKCPTP